jgi:hypothetical protein
MSKKLLSFRPQRRRSDRQSLSCFYPAATFVIPSKRLEQRRFPNFRPIG